MLSLPHAAVEAGLGTLGLNLQLLTPEFGPRVLLTAVLCSVDVACDQRMETALCLGPSCGRCLKTCPADAVGHWSRDWPSCDRFRSPHGFAKLSEHVTRIIAEPDAARQKDLVRSEKSFDLWQSILRGAGVITGCRRCADVCPVGADYAAMLSDALEDDSGKYSGKGSACRGDGGGGKGRIGAGRLCRSAAAGSAPCRPPHPDRDDAACRAAEEHGPRLSASNPKARSARSRRRSARRSTGASSTT